MLNVGTPEMFVILVVALLVLGPQKLPEVARQVGKAIGEVRRLGAGFQAEMRDAMQEPVKMDPVEPSDTPVDIEGEGVAPGWSPDQTDVLAPTVDEDPPGGDAPV